MKLPTLLRHCSFAVSVALTGCAAQTQHFDRGFGGEVRTLAAQQVRDPDASIKNKDRAVDGIDGRAAKQSMERYQRSFGEPPPPANVLSIGFGGSEGGRGASR